MFNNAIKKFAAVGLVFSLCVPCCFASAQPPHCFCHTINLIATPDINILPEAINELLQRNHANYLAQHQPSALERFWNEYCGRDFFTVEGQHFGTGQEFVNEIRRIGTPEPLISRAVLDHLISNANLSLNDALAMTQEVIAEIYNLDKIESGLHAMQTLEELKAHPILSKRIFK